MSEAVRRLPRSPTVPAEAGERCLELLAGMADVDFVHDLNIDRTHIRGGRACHGGLCLNELDLYVWYAQIDRRPGSYHIEALRTLSQGTRVVVDPERFAVGVDTYRAHLLAISFARVVGSGNSSVSLTALHLKECVRRSCSVVVPGMGICSGQGHAFGVTGAAGFAPGYRVNMSTRAELRRIRRIHRWMQIILPRVVRRVVNGDVSQPGWLPHRWMTLVSGDVDLDAGVGAVWLVRRPRSAKAETHTALIERCGETWQYTGGGSASDGDLPAGRLAVGQPGQVGMIEVGEGTGGLSYAYRLRGSCHPDIIGTAPWVGSNMLQVAAEVDHLLLGDRRIEVPGHGRFIVVWKSPYTGHGGIRPLIVAVGRDGSELSRIGPHDSMDSYTWAQLSGQVEQ